MLTKDKNSIKSNKNVANSTVLVNLFITSMLTLRVCMLVKAFINAGGKNLRNNKKDGG